MRCDAFWGLADSPPNKYMVEFSKEDVENLMKNWNFISDKEHLGGQVFDVLFEEYKKYNKEVDK